MKTFHQLLAADPNVAAELRYIFDDGPSVVTCEWCGCQTDSPVFRGGLPIAPSCLPAYEADQAESAAIDAELARDSDHPEPPVRNVRMRRKQAARETGADYGRSTTGDLIGDKADQYGDVHRQGIEDVA